MKSFYTLVSILALSLVFISCEKEVDSNNPTTPTPTPTVLPVVFTANMNFMDEGTSATMNGVSAYPIVLGYTSETSGYIGQDSVLNLTFTDEVSQIDFDFSLVINGGNIQPGTYSFTNPTTDYELSMYLTNSQSGKVYTYMNAYNDPGTQYNGQPITPNGTITITSVNQTTISGTLNAELYYTSIDVTNNSHKLIISNGAFNCDIIRFP